MELFWGKIIAAWLKPDVVLILVFILSFAYLLFLLFISFVLLYCAAEEGFKSLTGFYPHSGSIKMVLKYRSFLDKAMLWKLKISDKRDMETEIIKQTSQTGISIINDDNDHGLKDIIILKELERGIKTLPPALINFVNSHPAGPFNLLVAASDLGTSWGGSPTFMNYNEDKNLCRVNKESCFSLDHYWDCIIHEIGHAFEFVLDPEEYAKLGCLRKWTLFTDGIKEPPPTEYAKREHWGEDFAETFRFYFANPKYLKEKCPLRYEKMKEVLQKANIKR